jgi:hypothetical protein
MRVTTHGVWKGNWIYWAFWYVTRDYTKQITDTHTNSHASVFSHGLHQSFGNGFQRLMFHSFCVPERLPCLNHINCRLSNSQQLPTHSRLNLYTSIKKAVSSSWNTVQVQVQVQVILRPTVSRPLVLVSGPLWGTGPDFNFLCLTIIFFLLRLGALPDKRMGL